MPETSVDTTHLTELLYAHKWVPIAAIVIGLLVRLQKTGKLPLLDKIPPNYRSWLALGLGLVSGVLDRVVQGTHWLTAILDGLLAGVLAITAHDTLIEGLRSGKEIGGGGAKAPDPSPVPADDLKPPSNGGKILGIAIFVAATQFITSGIVACGYGKPACNIVDVAKYNCDLWIRYLAEDGTIKEVRMPPEVAREYARMEAKKQAIQDGGAP